MYKMYISSECVLSLTAMGFRIVHINAWNPSCHHRTIESFSHICIFSHIYSTSRNRYVIGLLQLVVNKPISGYIRSPCISLFRQIRIGFSIDLLQALLAELQQCCFLQTCRNLLQQRSASAVVNKLQP